MLSFIFGVLTLAIAFGINSALKFSPVDPFGSGAAWQFGPRELAHFSGSLGAVLISWPILQVMFNYKIGKIAYFYVFLCFLLIMFVHRFLMNGEPEFKYLLWGGAYIATSCIFLTSTLLRNKGFNALWILISSACFIELFNLFWEVIQQPLIGYRGEAPKNSIQPAQMLCDFIGVLAGFYVSLLVLNIADKLKCNEAAT
jgi:hypothetical protein